VIGRSLNRFNSNPIIDLTTYALLAAEILFCRLNGDIPEEKLDLFEFTTRCMAKPCARSAKVMRCQSFDSGLLGAIFDDVPDNPLRYAVTPGLSRTADAPEQAAIPYLGGSKPRINRGLDPFLDGHSTNVAAFADQIHNGPVLLASLKVRYIGLCGFPPTQTTTQQYCEQRPISFALESGAIGYPPRCGGCARLRS
jgi:hypothetical protein